MIKVVALMNAREGMSAAEFSHHWKTVHNRIVWQLPGLVRYVQNYATAHSEEWPYDGMAELWFEAKRDVAIAFSSPQAEPMREDEKKFIGRMQWFLVDELEMVNPSPTPSTGS